MNAQPSSDGSELLKDLGELGTKHHAARGAILFHEGTPPVGVLAIRAGQVKLYASAPTGRRLQLRMAGPGDVLGLCACVSGHPYELSAQAVTRVEYDFVPRERFVELLGSHPEVSCSIAKMLTTQLGAAYSRLRSLRRRRAPRTSAH
jgi:CRP/FNR family transcriptional regulator